MGHQAAVAADGEPRALPRRLGQVGRSRVSPQWSPKALTKLRAWGWHLVHEGGTGPGGPQQNTRARGLGGPLSPQGPEGRALHTDCTVAGSGDKTHTGQVQAHRVGTSRGSLQFFGFVMDGSRDVGSLQVQGENVRMQRSQVGPAYEEGVSALTGGRPECEMLLSRDIARSQGPLGQPAMLGSWGRAHHSLLWTALDQVANGPGWTLGGAGMAPQGS